MSTSLKDTIRPLVPKSVLDAKRKFHYYFVDEERSVPLDVLRFDPRLPFSALNANNWPIRWKSRTPAFAAPIRTPKPSPS